MAQNIYDEATFFASYSALPRSVDGLAAAPEFPTLAALLPDLRGLRVLDLGCGFGWFCRWSREHGASDVVGIDLSTNMLARAADLTSDPAISYERGDLDELDLNGERFGVVYSSLALHYVARLDRVVASVRAALPHGGRFVFSVEHPIYTAPRRPAWQKGHDGTMTWPLDQYQVEGPRVTNWLAEGVIKQHRTVGTYVACLLAAGFAVSALVEWKPDAAQLAEHPDWISELDRPGFLLMAATAT